MANKEKRPVPVMAVVIVALVAAGGAAFWYLDYLSKQPRPEPSLTGEAKAYVKSLRLYDVEMQAHESYLKQRVVEITGKIGNSGERPMKTVQVNCVFYDAYGQMCLRERVAIVGAKQGRLAPGEIKSFRLPFDNIPASWNQAMPQLVIAQIVFE